MSEGMVIQPIPIEDKADKADGPPHELVADLHAAYEAAYAGENPGPPYHLPRFRNNVCTHAPGARIEAWAAIEGGEVIGGYAVRLYQLDNRHVGQMPFLAVRPGHRGRGVGSALLEHAIGRLRAHGRTLLLTETPAIGTGARFVRAHGLTESIVEARRTFDLRKADWTALERMIPKVDGYSLERWIGPAAPELLPDLATIAAGMNDAPRDDDSEDTDYSLERLRAREEGIPRSGLTAYTMVARRDADGAPAGYTRIVLATDGAAGWAEQADTTVLREHRGHRLGLLLKLSNALWLREREPGVERVITWNATSNAHMLAINEAMGFELFDEWIGWRLDL
ncbi:GNAT family N-acetyltransferase [Nonomuraea sp. NPDC050404]|uniref:GNAT family N-acetyltransferase n=1 Tax=Nonomuraea sp. NPDC050404 TaxID=3155783 RepID=UPI0033DE039E